MNEEIVFKLFILQYPEKVKIYKGKFREVNTLLRHLKVRVRDKYNLWLEEKKNTVRVSPGPHTIGHALHIADS